MDCNKLQELLVKGYNLTTKLFYFNLKHIKKYIYEFNNEFLISQTENKEN